MGKQQIGVVLVNNNRLSVHGHRLRIQSDSFWPYSSGNKSTNDIHQQTGMIQRNKSTMTNLPKDSIRDNDKNENSSTRFYHQVSRNVNGLTKSTTKGNQLSASVLPPNPTPPEPYRPTTAPLILDESIRQIISARIRSNSPTRPRNPRVIDVADHLTNSSLFQFKSTIFENDNQFIEQSYIDTNSRDNFLDSSVVLNPPDETTINDEQDEPKILHRNSQCQINGFQHIANLGNSNNRQIELSENLNEIAYEEDHSLKRIYEYKSPFSEEYDQAISLQSNNNINEWNLKDFYRDVKTQFEPGTNTKTVFEKCLKLSKLQANTIKWEQRRRQTLNTYNRFIKNPTIDNSLTNFPGNFSPNITDLKRELRCNECKRVSCLGNCAPGQEYHQYKRFIPISSLPNTREQIRCKLNLRTQRSMIDIRPRSQQQMIRVEQTNINPVVVVPLFEDDSQTKRPQKKLTHGFLPGRSFRSQRRETLALISSHKILS